MKKGFVVGSLLISCFLFILWAPCEADDLIYGCYAKKSGALRIVSDLSRCKTKTEKPISWPKNWGACSCDTLTMGLVAYYPFDGNANDESGNGYHGTVFGATLTTDRFGNPNSAYSFDGPSGNTITTSLVPPNIFSLSLWYKASATQLQNAGIASTYSTALYNGFYYAHGGSREAIRSDGNTTHDMPHPDVDNWINLVIVSDGAQISVYKNGNLVLSFSGTTTHADTLILGSSRFNGKFFTGIIDDVRIYNRALSVPEIQRLYNE